MKHFISSALFAFGFVFKIAIVTAEKPFVRYNTGCQLLLNDTRIYCYSGGYAKTVGGEITPLSDHYYLDVKNDFDVATGRDSWMRVPDPTNFVTEATFGYNSIKISDTSVLINGGTGINDGKTFMKNRTVIYHADKNQWEPVTNTNSFNQSYYSSGVLAGNNTIVFWGGAGAIGDLVPTFYGTAKLLLSTKEWSLQPNSVAPGNPRYGHSATVDPSGKMIYYFGGRDIIRDPVTGVYTRPFSSFANILIYNTNTAVWESKIASTAVTPSNRMSHTASWIPNTDSIIIYGGSSIDNAGNRVTVNDYVYTYNTKSNAFQTVTIPTASGVEGPGPRFGHSAVIRNNSFFILFGIDNSKIAQSDFHVMDLETFAWQARYMTNKVPSIDNSTEPVNKDGSNNSSKENSTKPNDGDSSISPGAIAGIVVGSLAAVAAIILVFIFIRRRAKKNKEKAANEYTPYWDITSLHDKKDIDGENEIPLTSTGPVDITKLPGFTTCRTGQPTNSKNDKDIDPPPQKPQPAKTDNNDPSSPQNTESSHTFSNNVSEPEKLWPPDAPMKTTITPSIPVEYTVPDIGKQ